ncbi:hypothetical protein AB1Y20_000889 [Prymnesium parvum]|uniref:Ubiquitin-fold modifier 1 n=1 Tax=Prymnesium parvum TaxID=97485 RepID=A0AB34K9G3_PRYPA|mmetsp:Transcript_14099/g.35167  ORF Transcript_14099/g.35167 Transcript_14099/m.35167 type:complete len:137 (-) Transcript_14099:240-650(-)
MFVVEGELITCCTDLEDSKVFSAFRGRYGTATSERSPGALPPDAMLLFKVRVEETGAPKTKKAPVLFVGAAHSASFSLVLAFFNRQFSVSSDKSGAFLLEGGFGVNPNQSAGQVFMKYGHELTFHTKVELSRVAWR